MQLLSSSFVAQWRGRGSKRKVFLFTAVHHLLECPAADLAGRFDCLILATMLGNSLAEIMAVYRTKLNAGGNPTAILKVQSEHFFSK